MRKDSDVALNVLPPGEVSVEDRAAFEKMVLEAGEVNPNTLPGLIDRALALAFARLNGALVGVGAIKRPHGSHRGDVFKWAKSDLDPKQFPFELGWVYVKPAAQRRRIASRLVGKLMPVLKGARVYATSRVNNDRMHSSLKRFAFKPVGVPYPSKQNEPEIQLFVCTGGALGRVRAVFLSWSAALLSKAKAQGMTCTRAAFRDPHFAHAASLTTVGRSGGSR